MHTKIITTNKKAYFDYEIIDTLEAGIVLTGPEVKSVKQGNISLKESYAVIKDDEVFLLNAHISPYKFAASEQEPTRTRKLLLKAKEIRYLIGKTKEKGLTLVPTKIYLKHGLIKVELGLGRGKKKYEKKEKIKKRDIEREIQREIRGK